MALAAASQMSAKPKIRAPVVPTSSSDRHFLVIFQYYCRGLLAGDHTRCTWSAAFSSSISCFDAQLKCGSTSTMVNVTLPLPIEMRSTRPVGCR
mmetsp:Transcript_113012/g.155989  ORF Transcript_113012/g.155989 Transcript_113012/m.155989 type:complete len:94 (+) Transcript_113012:83-364(+)